jgi:glycosyltransferase involved in cell wall biosynthesis
MVDSLVTVSIASYNNANYISRCLDSVIRQSYTNLEILVIDDGSSDNTEEILNQYAGKKRIKFVKKKNEGLSSVRQLALDMAEGKYICFIDADDYLSETYIEVMLNRIVQSGSDICVCGTRFEDENGRYLSTFSELFKCYDITEPYKPSYSDMNQYGNQNIGGLHISDSWNKLYNLEFLRSSQVKFDVPKGLNGSDEFFNRLLLLHRPNYITVSQELYVHIMYQNSAVHRKSKNLIASFALILDSMIKECKKLNVLNELKGFLSIYYITSIYAAHLDVLGDKENDFSKIRYEDEKLQENYVFLKKSECTGIPKNISLFFFLYKNYPSLVPLLFKIRVSLKKIIRNDI